MKYLNGFAHMHLRSLHAENAACLQLLSEKVLASSSLN